MSYSLLADFLQKVFADVVIFQDAFQFCPLPAGKRVAME